MLWLMYFATSTGEACEMTDKAIKELKTESPKYAAAPFMRINIDLEGNQSQKYEKETCAKAGQSLPHMGARRPLLISIFIIHTHNIHCFRENVV